VTAPLGRASGRGREEEATRRKHWPGNGGWRAALRPPLLLAAAGGGAGRAPPTATLPSRCGRLTPPPSPACRIWAAQPGAAVCSAGGGGQAQARCLATQPAGSCRSAGSSQRPPQRRPRAASAARARAERAPEEAARCDGLEHGVVERQAALHGGALAGSGRGRRDSLSLRRGPAPCFARQCTSAVEQQRRPRQRPAHVASMPKEMAAAGVGGAALDLGLPRLNSIVIPWTAGSMTKPSTTGTMLVSVRAQACNSRACPRANAKRH